MNRQTHKLSLFTTTLFLLLLTINSVQAQKFTAHYNTSIAPNTNGFYDYLPQGYSATGTTLYPLLIFIHGMGEYGSGSSTSLPAILKHGTPRYIKEGIFPTSFTVNGKTSKFIVLSPQWKSQASISNVNALIDYALRHYKVDAKRIYITGLSAGGGVVENVVSDLTVGKRIAAAVEFCGTTTPSTTRAANIVANNVAFWGLHNLYDNIVSSSKTKNWVGYILSKKSTFPAKKTIFNTSGHNCWYTPYHATWKENNYSIYEWMLLHQRGTTTTATNTPPVANAGSDKTITLPTNSVTLYGSGTDVNGSISKYSWTKVSGPSTYALSSTTTASTTAKYLVAGTYVFRLKVTDNAGAIDYDDVNVVVKSATTSTTTTYTKIEAENYSSMSGVQKETTSDAGGGQDVGYIDMNDWMEYKLSVSTAGTYNITFRLASGVTGGKFDVLNASGTRLASVYVPNTGGFQSWKDVTTTIKLPSGSQTLMLYSTGTPRWNINYFKYAISSGTTTSTALASGVGTTAVAEQDAATTTTGIAVSPNPFSDKFVLQVNTANTGTMKVQLIDQSGVVRKQFQVAKNVAGTMQTYLSAGTLPAGNYFVKVQIGEWTQSLQVVKL